MRAPARSASEDRLRIEVRRAIADAGLTQRAIANELGLTEKHVSQMLTGKAHLSLDWADRIAKLCGRRVSVKLTSAKAGSA
jgi:plasmid maintenance system antidote protein VapI